jgi:hypothetical protein
MVVSFSVYRRICSYTTRRYKTVILSQVVRRISPYSVVYDWARFTWEVAKDRAHFIYSLDWTDKLFFFSELTMCFFDLVQTETLEIDGLWKNFIWKVLLILLYHLTCEKRMSSLFVNDAYVSFERIEKNEEIVQTLMEDIYRRKEWLCLVRQWDEYLSRDRNRTEYSAIRFGSIRLNRIESSRFMIFYRQIESNRVELGLSKRRIESYLLRRPSNRIEPNRSWCIRLLEPSIFSI